VDSSRYREIWVELPDGQSLCVLINDDIGWLMYLRCKGDAGFSSRNLDYSGPPHATVEYRLSNGQRDEYPASWALPLSEVERALAFFRANQRLPPFIHWHNDAGDGATSPTAA
jgi:hypothetical protein